jgi:hypothetical protein
LENALQNKDNIIIELRKTIENLKNYNNLQNCVCEKSYIDNVIYITEPTIAINKIYDELKIYKECYKNISDHFNHIKKKADKYQFIIKVIYLIL